MQYRLSRAMNALRPAQIVHTAMLNRSAGLTEEMRAQRRRALLIQSPESVRQAATHFWAKFAHLHNDCLLGPQEFARQLDLTAFQI